MRKYFSVTIFLSLFFIFPFGKKGSGLAFAQSYPIQLTTQLLPPYSGYLPDYATVGNEKLHLILLLKDLSKPVYALRLSVKIEGQGFVLQSKPFFKGPLVNLDPGLPAELSADVLAQLLDSKNLDFSGIDKADYEQRKVLPEGYYKICFTAYDYYNPLNIQVSNESCASAWMTLSDPPRLNLPLCGSTLSTGTPQQITFSWMPMNMGSPNSAQNTEYVFELWEIRPEGAEPNNVVQTLPPVFSLSTSFTTLNYGLAETPLNPGMEYAWRVRATDKNGYDNFKNKGYSEVCSFRYGNKYESLGDALKLNLQAIPLSARMAKLQWDSLAIYTQYAVNYRKQGKGEWFGSSTNTGSLKVYDLEPQMVYEARVQGSTNDGYTGPWSNTVVFQTPAPAQYACGDLPTSTPEQNVKPLLSAFAGIIIQVGLFEMRATQIQGSNGYYSGLGRIKVPFAATDLNVAYDNIYVNEDRQLLIGEVKAISEGVENWVQKNSTIKTGKDTTELTTVFVITEKTNVQIDTTKKTITITTADGTPVVFSYTGTLPVTIKDKDGNLFVIDENGKLKHIGKSGKGTPIESKNILNTKDAKVTFAASDKQQYGFDTYQYPHLKEKYLTIKDRADNSTQLVNWKAVESAKADVVRAEISISNKAIKPDSIYFITSTGTIYNSTGNKTTREITIAGGPDRDGQELYAAYKTGKDSVTYIGKLTIASYAKVKNKVVLVPLIKDTNEKINLNTKQIEEDLNKIYAQAAVEWEVEAAPLIPEPGWDANNSGSIAVSSDLLSSYSDEMKALNRQLRSQALYDTKKYYLFISYLPAESEIEGEMPRSRNIGYIFASGQGKNLSNIIAHELGHGAFNLGHPFAEFENTARGSTNNLMDYNSETFLNKYQWDALHEPINPLVLFDSDENAQMVGLQKQTMEFLANVKNVNRKNTILSLSDYRSYISASDVYLNGIHYDYIGIRMLPQYGTSIRPKGSITYSEFNSNYPYEGVKKKCIDIQGIVKIFAQPASQLEDLKQYLQLEVPEKNILLFVNGYRSNDPSMAELPKERDEVSQADKFNYWGSISASFVNQIGTKNVVFADGHHSITTSNHKNGNGISSQVNFMLSLRSSARTSGNLASTLLNASIAFMCPPLAMYELGKDYNCYHNDKCVELNTTPNTSGFNERKTNGMKAGNDLLQKLHGGEIPCRKNDRGEIIDTLDIVCHSMGFAYAQGMIEIMKIAKIKLGRYYILAPENACSGSVTLSDFEEVWQYGSNLGMINQDPLWEQDGVAPQCIIQNLSEEQRIEIPANPGFKKDFVESHLVKNYGWIFKIENPSKEGYVKTRN